MNVSTRDRRIIVVVAVLAVIAGYWLLLLGPKRSEAADLGEQVAAARADRDEAVSTLARLRSSRTTFAADYASVVRLGKAVPDDVDMPSLLVQLERAAARADIDFSRITAGDRVAAEPAAAAPATPAPGGEGQAASAPGQAAQNAQETAADAGAAAEQSGLDPADAQTSTTAREGAVPVGGAAGGGSAAPAAAGAPAPPGLETVPLEFDFRGSFFDLADFFHSLKRYVEVANDELIVRGRLLTIDSLDFSSGESFPDIRAQVKATAYLVPAAQGVSAGATPQGPAAQPVSGQAPTGGAPAQGGPPAATAAPAGGTP